MSKKIFKGVVVNTKSNKTVKVSVLVMSRHKIYGKFIRKYKKYMVHDENNQCKSGDIVKIQESVPISSTKKWIVI